MGDVIGFIGLGHMEAPMAGRLLDGGYALVLHDEQDHTAIARLVEEWADVALRTGGGKA
jgi:3-hydroxyisobutyrate dehydrogenase-like beta-hydroxyacid dehydrogenase